MLELRRYADSPLSSGWTATTDVGDVTSESTASYGSPPRKWENPARTIGRLAQLHVTRADLAAATSMLASALTIWGPKHDRALTHVMRYLAKHRSRVIVYRSAAAVGNAPALEIWADASFANELYHGSTLLAKSRTGLLVLAFGALLYATSVRQTAVALSTCEAETSAHALATRVAIPIRLTLVALQCYRLPRPVAIHCDNTAVLALIKRRHVNSRLRHYRVNIAFVFHAIELGLTTVRYCKTTHMRADFLTKALPVGAFRANAALVYPDYEYAPL
jgi:hypothetical protein